ncbi:hypothetical protein BC941DRAFT_500957 [Chlamydoabsidia padenii]|nr:hypothetical protein BC941DRAFT_500957 [Chlamydoabsidia padenii]
MYLFLLVLSLSIMSVLAYPVSRFLIEVQEPTVGMPLSKAMVITEDMQTYYENLLDQIISSHSEEFLLSMANSMTRENMDTIYRPQATMLLGKSDPVHDVCLYRMPQWIGKYVHDTHAKTYEMVSPVIQSYMDHHWHQQEMTPNDIKEFLVSLNRHLINRIEQTMLDPRIVLSDLAAKLQSCQQNYEKSFFLKRLYMRVFQTKFINEGDMQNHFLVKYMEEMHMDLVSQIDDGVPDLVELIQNDLDDDFVTD